MSAQPLPQTANDVPEVIYSYTRRQALADGFQVQVPDATAREAGFRCPVYVTRSAWNLCVEVPEGVTCQDVDGRLWDLLWMARMAAKHSEEEGGTPLPFVAYVRNTARRPKKAQLYVQAGANDIDDPTPCLCIMLPEDL